MYRVLTRRPTLYSTTSPLNEPNSIREVPLSTNDHKKPIKSTCPTKAGIPHLHDSRSSLACTEVITRTAIVKVPASFVTRKSSALMVIIDRVSRRRGMVPLKFTNRCTKPNPIYHELLAVTLYILLYDSLSLPSISSPVFFFFISSEICGARS